MFTGYLHVSSLLREVVYSGWPTQGDAVMTDTEMLFVPEARLLGTLVHDDQYAAVQPYTWAVPCTARPRGETAQCWNALRSWAIAHITAFWGFPHSSSYPNCHWSGCLWGTQMVNHWILIGQESYCPEGWPNQHTDSFSCLVQYI